MSLIKCSECGKDVSDKAASCPNCGNPINQPTPQHEEYLCCPRCNSRELHAEHKGFSGGKALVGAVTVGGLGLLAGTIGSRDTQITCLKCGNRFKAGEAKMVSNAKPKSDKEAEAIDAVKRLGAIGACKWYMEKYGVGLADAKNYIDSITEKYSLSRKMEGAATSGKGCMLPILIAVASTVSLLLIL